MLVVCYPPTVANEACPVPQHILSVSANLLQRPAWVPVLHQQLNIAYEGNNTVLVEDLWREPAIATGLATWVPSTKRATYPRLPSLTCSLMKKRFLMQTLVRISVSPAGTWSHIPVDAPALPSKAQGFAGYPSQPSTTAGPPTAAVWGASTCSAKALLLAGIPRTLARAAALCHQS